MFEALFGYEYSLNLDKTTSKSVMDRLNMGRLYLFSLVGCVFVLLVTGLFAACKFYILPQSYQNFGFLMFALILGLSAATVLVSSRTHRSELFDKECFIFLALFSAVMYNFAFRAVSSATSLVLFSVIMMVIGLLPILPIGIFVPVWVVNIIPMIVLVAVKHLTADSIASVITISIMSFVLSFVSYTGTIRKLSYKLSLDDALSEAETDPMTKLLNRRGLDRRLDSLWPHCIRQHTSIAVLMLDIDNFKRYNDTFGHPAGDECIKKVTSAIHRQVKRRTDYAARVGGEEFLIFLTGIDAKQAVKWALELKAAIDDLKIPHAETNFNPYVSVSMGLECATITDGITFDMMKEQADKALYEAKDNGRACLYFRHRCFGRKSLFAKAQ